MPNRPSQPPAETTFFPVFRKDQLPPPGDDGASADWLHIAAVLVARAIATGDRSACERLSHDLVQAVAALDDRLGVRVHGLLDVVRAATDVGTVASEAPTSGTLQARFLELVHAEPELQGRQLADRLGTDESQVSRTGRVLSEAGLVERTKEGRVTRWRVTAEGRRAAQAIQGRSPADVARAAQRAFERLIDATDDEPVIDAAAELSRFGVLQRKSTLPRGSVVQVAAPRLPEPVEEQLVGNIVSGSATFGAVVGAAGEWGSHAAATTLSLLILDAVLSPAEELAAVQALGKLGGLDAVRALTSIAARPDCPVELVIATLSAIGPLADGGQVDVTEPGPDPAPSPRWVSDDPRRAEQQLNELLVALQLSAGATTGHVARRARNLGDLIVRWAHANNIPVAASSEDPVAAVVRGAEFFLEFAALETLETHRSGTTDEATVRRGSIEVGGQFINVVIRLGASDGGPSSVEVEIQRDGRDAVGSMSVDVLDAAGHASRLTAQHSDLLWRWAGTVPPSHRPTVVRFHQA